MLEYISCGLMKSLSIFARLPFVLPRGCGGSGWGRGGEGGMRDLVNVVQSHN